jgi:ppGpp synthetase/RelA/SpoT-type nucleotidyltranferase
MPRISIDKQIAHIDAYKKVYPLYEDFSGLLKVILAKAKDIYAPMGLVEARAKKIESFSEKIIRKDKYENPLENMTDLCGARVIAHFSNQVHDICRFIEENFEIDTENSLDLKSRLQTSEFGYRSIHYIVTPRNAKILGVDIEDRFRNLKAEIQVRTFHEHIWADILHDRIYKSTLIVTEDWKRESARLAAMLEEADNAFAGISDTIDQLSINYQPTPSISKLQSEIEILNALIGLDSKIDEKNAKKRLRLSRIYNLLGEWDKTNSLLASVLFETGIDEATMAGMKREYGYALCNANFENTNSVQFLEGLSHLHAAKDILVRLPSRSRELAFTCKLLADADESLASEYLTEANRLAPENPYYFTALLVDQFKGKSGSPSISMELLSSRIKQVTEELRNHIGLGIERPEAYLGLGKMLYLQSDFKASAACYLQLLKLIRIKELGVSKEQLINELKSIEKINVHNPLQAEILKCLVHLILWQQFGDTDSESYLYRLRSKESVPSDQILIICGKSQELTHETEKSYTEFLEEALLDFEGTVISGGTPVGIPGLVGTISASKKKNNTKKYTAIGYLPKGVHQDNDYDYCVRTNSSEYSFLEAVYYWIDLLFNGVQPEKVFVLGMDGGVISSLEYKFALALNARVCLVGKSGGSAGNVVNDPEWNTLANLFNIPDDPFTIWAMLNQDKNGELTTSQIQMLAPVVHEFYRLKLRKGLNPETVTDINKYRVLMQWDKLSVSLQNSNLKQVAFMEQIFRRGGLRFQKSAQPMKFIIHDKFPTRDLMAQLEHARWNAERLLDGWKYGPVKDVLKKTSNCIVPWKELDAETRTYDYDPVANFPELLMSIGYEVVKIEQDQ